MDEPSAVIKNNDQDLKTHIANEVAKKIPIFYSYRSFCKSVGQDTMKYPDFEFWYYRFYHGEMDFDYDRSVDPVPKTIMDMPVKLMHKIVENLDPVERAYLRYMNKSIKEVADSHPPVFEKIFISLTDAYLCWSLNDKEFRCCKEGNGCILPTSHKEINNDENFKEKCLKYLTPLFKIPKIQVNRLYLTLFKGSQTISDILPVSFHAKSAELYAFDMDHIFPFLSVMNPGELESIHLRSTSWDGSDQMLRFFETEQFKHAKHVDLEGYYKVDDLLRFSHLKSFKCEVDFFEAVDFQRIRDIVSTFKQFESCELTRANYLNDFDIRTVAEALGAEIPLGRLNTITYRYQIPESDEFLEFKIGYKFYHYTIKIVKNR